MTCGECLLREEWDFSKLPTEELIPALIWEVRRESPEVDAIVLRVRACRRGALSNKRPRRWRAQYAGRRSRCHFRFSEADKARLQAEAVFASFIPFHEFALLHKWDKNKCRAEWDGWIDRYLAPVLEYYPRPWQSLPSEERRRLCVTWNSNRVANVVSVGSWWDAVAHFNKLKPDPGLPLTFHFFEKTHVLLTIDWSHSKKRILAAIAELLPQCEPEDRCCIKVWNRRGKKHRDLLVMLERMAIMRLLHHFTLTELRHRLPEAWALYLGRKWYDDRRRALRDCRALLHYREAETRFPKSWLTRAHVRHSSTKPPAKWLSV